MAMKPWVKLPTAWIEAGGLKSFRWKQEDGSANVAALMVLAVIAHHANADDGKARLTYDALTAATDLSRSLISRGLRVLCERDILERAPDKRSVYRLAGYDPKRGWGKLPARGLYAGKRIEAFKQFFLRRPVELHALKAYFLFVSRRDNFTNLTMLSHDKIYKYSGIPRNKIKGAISLLVANDLVHVEHVPSTISEQGVANAYRLTHLDATRHMGTTGRRLIAERNAFE